MRGLGNENENEINPRAMRCIMKVPWLRIGYAFSGFGGYLFGRIGRIHE